MSVVYSIRWRLIFLDGRIQDELLAGSPIADRWPNPVELHLIDLTGKTVQGIAIPQGNKPIFYRQRSIAQGENGEMGETQLDATVFGYGRENGSKVDGKLWMWRSGKAVDCPPEHIAQRAIEVQLQA
jgi:hypothetical protein